MPQLLLVVLLPLVLLGGHVQRTKLQMGRTRGRAQECEDGGHASLLLGRRLLAVVGAQRRRQRGDVCAALSACGRC